MNVTVLEIPSAHMKSRNGIEKWIDMVSCFARLNHPDQSYQRLLAFMRSETQASCSFLLVKFPDAREWTLRCVCPHNNLNHLPAGNKFLDEVIEKSQSLRVLNDSEGPFLSGFPLFFFPIPDQEKKVSAILGFIREGPNLRTLEEADLLKLGYIVKVFKDILIQEIRNLENAVDHEIRKLELFVGNSPGMRQVYRDIKQVADANSIVYVHGETGTGKELVAQSIHSLSGRTHNPLIALNCSTVPTELAESELFGHEKGAFTGACSTRFGKFELANGGTLFLDEIGELPMYTQGKFLRVLEEKEVWRVGGSKKIPLDVRMVVATHRDLEREVAGKRFRADLFYRLHVFPIHIPPLRNRGEDITLLARHFLKETAPHIPGFHHDALHRIQSGRWPGNVRQLKNCIERGALYHTGTGPLTSQHLFTLKRDSQDISTFPPSPGNGGSLDNKIKEMVKEALSRNQFNKSQTSRELKITRPRLDRLVEKYNIWL